MDKTSEEASSKGKKRQRDQQPTDPQTNQLHHQILSLGLYIHLLLLFLLL